MTTAQQTTSTLAIWRRPRVESERGKGRSATYADIQNGLFTRPVKIGPRSVGWPANEVVALNAALIAGKSEDEIRVLVAKLEASRSHAFAELTEA